MTNHYLHCSAPICPFDPTLPDNLDHWCWYPDELICGKQPHTHIQKIQKRIQKLFHAGKISNTRYFSVRMLQDIQRVAGGIKGENPNRRHDTSGKPIVKKKKAFNTAKREAHPSLMSI